MWFIAAAAGELWLPPLDDIKLIFLKFGQLEMSISKILIIVKEMFPNSKVQRNEQQQPSHIEKGMSKYEKLKDYYLEHR